MSKIRKTVITAAGKGMRLLPYTKETPKEMMPIYSKTENGKIVLKPILQIIYESIFDYGIKDFCFIVGRGKRSIEDHFVMSEQENQKKIVNVELKKLYNKIQISNLVYVQQSTPRGFGDAVLKGKFFVGKDIFLLHAGDDVILSKNNNHLRRLEDAFFKYKADLAFLVTRINDPRSYGVIEGIKNRDGVINVEKLEEKPKKPKSNLAVIATYIFKPSIFQTLEKTKPNKKGEVQLADAIKKEIRVGKAVAVELQKNEKRIDVGSPESYISCLKESYKFSK